MEHKVAEDGDWQIHNSPEKRLIPMHYCHEQRRIHDHMDGLRSVKWKLPCVAVFCKATGMIYCPRCYLPLPDELGVMMKLSGSHTKLTDSERYYGDIDY